MTLPKFIDALEAYARPIQEHARKAARAYANSEACDAIADGYDADVWSGAESSAHDEAPLRAGDAMQDLDVPTGAQEWARDVWAAAFRSELPRAFSEELSALKDRGDVSECDNCGATNPAAKMHRHKGDFAAPEGIFCGGCVR